MSREFVKSISKEIIAATAQIIAYRLSEHPKNKKFTLAVVPVPIGTGEVIGDDKAPAGSEITAKRKVGF